MQAAFDISEHNIYCTGCWTQQAIGAVLSDLAVFSKKFPNAEEFVIDGAKLERLDSAGAWALSNLIHQLECHGKKIRLQGFSKEASHLLGLVSKHRNELPEKDKLPGYLTELGMRIYSGLDQMYYLLGLLGEIFICALGWLRHPSRIRWHALWAGVYASGHKAIGIVALLSFLIGLVLAYQMGIQLENYGAGIFVVDLTGLSILREFGPLITAIIVAGRSGSAFTAQIGTMKLNQEIDALNTLGLSPTELIVLPKFFALLIALPLLSVIADITGVMGGMFMAKVQLGIGFEDFLHRFQESIGIKTYIMGLVKTPIFAALIAGIGCFQGFCVEGDAESVGRHTTTSVVQSIFMIIVADAAFSIFYSMMGL